MRHANNEADIIEQVEMKEKIKKEYHRRTRKLLETKLNSRNLIKGDTYLGCPSRRILTSKSSWSGLENNLNTWGKKKPKTRKLITMHSALHPWGRRLTDYMCQEKKMKEGLAIIEDSVDASIQQLEDYIEKVRRKSDYNH